MARAYKTHLNPLLRLRARESFGERKGDVNIFGTANIALEMGGKCRKFSWFQGAKKFAEVHCINGSSCLPSTVILFQFLMKDFVLCVNSSSNKLIFALLDSAIFTLGTNKVINIVNFSSSPTSSQKLNCFFICIGNEIIMLAAKLCERKMFLYDYESLKFIVFLFAAQGKFVRDSTV